MRERISMHGRIDAPVKRFHFRMPASMLVELKLRARKEGVSLNQFLIYLVTAGLGHWDPALVRRQMLKASLRRNVGREQYESERYQKA